MSKRMKVLLLAGVGLVVLAAIAAGTVYLVAENNKKDDIAKADQAAEEFIDEVDTFRSERSDLLGQVVEVNADDTVTAMESMLDEAPVLGDAPKYGRENSDDYAEAQELQEQLGEDLQVLDGIISNAVQADDFITAAEIAVNDDTPFDLIGTGPYPDGQHVRDVAIPGMQAVKNDFEAVAVPVGFEDAAAEISATLQYVIDGLTTMAAELDAGNSYSFSIQEQYTSAKMELNLAFLELEEQVDAAVEAFGSGEPIEAEEAA